MTTGATESERGQTAEPPETASGLESNVAGTLAYALGIFSGAFFYFTEDNDEFVRFHAAQSIVVSGALIAAWIVFSVASGILGSIFVTAGAVGFVWILLGPLLALVWLALSLVSLGLWIYLLVTTYRGDTVRVPVAATVADGLV